LLCVRSSCPTSLLNMPIGFSPPDEELHDWELSHRNDRQKIVANYLDLHAFIYSLLSVTVERLKATPSENPGDTLGGTRWRRYADGGSILHMSSARLSPHIVCTYCTPVADMPAHSPPLPLIIYYLDIGLETTAGDEEGRRLALQHYDRVGHVGFYLPTSILQSLSIAMEKQFPILEHMYILSRISLILPKTFQPPLLHLPLRRAALPIGSTLSITLILCKYPPTCLLPHKLPHMSFAHVSAGVAIYPFCSLLCYEGTAGYPDHDTGHTFVGFGSVELVLT
jgi:hypothetical protein